ncbi:MAG: PRD domain-containing protein [Lachnospiraceae bacterium]|nr:PRD domain-containing protein [Lachnospiraceae bacterium]
MDNFNKPKKTKTSLSRRQKQIIQILLQSAEKPVTVTAIAERLKVSSRTILRELPLIENWMNENDFQFIRKTGVGLQIAEHQENLELIRELLSLEKTAMVLGKEERRRRLIGELLFHTEPVKAYSFTSEYGISEGTLFGDLDHLDAWLMDHQVELVRRQGVGIFIQGDEKAIRQAVVSAVFDLYDINQIVGLLPIGNDSGSQEPIDLTESELPPLLVFLSGEERFLAGKILEEFRLSLDVRFRDSAMVGLYIRIALAIYRISSGCSIQDAPQDPELLQEHREYQAVKKVSRKLAESYHLDMNEAEVQNMAEHLSSARIWADASAISDPVRSINIRQFVTSLVGIVQNMTGLEFHEDPILMEDLVNHFSSVLEQNKKDMFPASMQMEPIQKEYPEIFSAAETAMEMLSDTFSTRNIMKEDAGFAAMHFAASAERLLTENERVTIVVVCPLGIGASRMLASSLSRNLHNVEILRTVSAFDLDADELRKEGVDLIVSTTDLNTDFPYVRIGKVLKTGDRVSLQDRIDQINTSRISGKLKKTAARPAKAGLADIRRIAGITREVLELIDHFRILQLLSIPDFQTLLEQAALLFAGSDLEKAEFLDSFRKREQNGSTYIEEMHISLLHCKSTSAKHSRFGYIRLEQPLQTKEGPVAGAVVMIAPERFTFECLEPVSRLSALLIEEPGFLQALQNGDTSSGAAIAEAELVKYCNNSII